MAHTLQEQVHQSPATPLQHRGLGTASAEQRYMPCFSSALMQDLVIMPGYGQFFQVFHFQAPESRLGFLCLGRWLCCSSTGFRNVPRIAGGQIWRMMSLWSRKARGLRKAPPLRLLMTMYVSGNSAVSPAVKHGLSQVVPFKIQSIQTNTFCHKGAYSCAFGA